MLTNYQLVIKAGPEEGKVIPLAMDPVTIGREQGVELTISDPEISRKHAKITYQGGQYVIQDLGSTNGTFVNNQRLTGPYVLRPGELIYLGEHVALQFEAITIDPDATVVSRRRQASAAAPLGTAPAAKVPAYQAAPPPATPRYAGAVPGQPSSQAVRKPLPRWAVVTIIIVVVVLLLCILPTIIIDSTNSWCRLFGGIFRAINPNTCPLP
jgi:predicted component of type VI protein secretion system